MVMAAYLSVWLSVCASVLSRPCSVRTVTILCVCLFLVLPQVVIDIRRGAGFTNIASCEQAGRRLTIIQQHLENINKTIPC